MSNLFNQFKGMMTDSPRGVAIVTGQRNSVEVIAETPAGVEIILKGTAETGKSVFYRKHDNMIIGEAPSVTWTEYGV